VLRPSLHNSVLTALMAGRLWALTGRCYIGLIDVAWFYQLYANTPKELDLPYPSPLRAASLANGRRSTSRCRQGRQKFYFIMLSVWLVKVFIVAPNIAPQSEQAPV